MMIKKQDHEACESTSSLAPCEAEGLGVSPSRQSALFSRDELLGRGGEGAPLLLEACPPRSVFASEAQFEATLLHEPEVLGLLSRTVGRTVGALTNQVVVPSSSLRVDVLGETANPAGGVVLELMLEPCDADHLQRGVLYTMALNRLALVLVAPSFPLSVLAQVGRVRSWLAEHREPFTVHLLELSTWRDAEGGHYALREIDPVRSLPVRARARLELIAAQAAELGDDVLVNLSVLDNRRLVSYQGLAPAMRILVYAGESSTRVSVMVRDADLLARLQEELRRSRLGAELGAVGVALNAPSPDSTLLGVDLPASEPPGGHPDPAETMSVARVFVLIRRALLEALNRVEGRGAIKAARARFHPGPVSRGGVGPVVRASSRLAT